MSVTHKVSDHHLHHDELTAAMTPHTDFISSQWWVQINIKEICQKFHANHYTNIYILSFQYILEAIERPNHDAG